MTAHVDPIILVHEVNLYGNTVLRPANDQARRMCDLLRTTTIPHSQLAAIKALGFTIEAIPVEPRRHL